MVFVVIMRVYSCINSSCVREVSALGIGSGGLDLSALYQISNRCFSFTWCFLSLLWDYMFIQFPETSGEL